MNFETFKIKVLQALQEIGLDIKGKAPEFSANEDEHSEHPEFASQEEFNIWVLQNIGNGGSTPYEDIFPQSGLIFRHNYIQETDTVLNDRKNAYDGEIVGTRTNVDGRVDNAWQTDSESYILIPGSFTLAFPFSYMAVFRKLSASNDVYIVTANATTYRGFEVFFGHSKIRVRLGDNGGTGVGNRKSFEIDNPVGNDTDWHLLAVNAADFNDVKFSIDGSDFTTIPYSSGDSQTVELDFEGFSIGRKTWVEELITPAIFDEDAFYNRLLTNTEISDLATQMQLEAPEIEQPTIPPSYTPETETTAYLNNISYSNDATLYNQGTPFEIRGDYYHYAWDKFFKAIKANVGITKIKHLYAYQGVGAEKAINLVNPANSGYLYNGTAEWLLSDLIAFPDKHTNRFRINEGFADISGIAPNNITIGSYVLSNGKAADSQGNLMPLFGNVENSGAQVFLLSDRNEVDARLTNSDNRIVTHNDNDASGAILVTIQSDNNRRYFKNAVKIGTVPNANGSFPAESEIYLRGDRYLENRTNHQSVFLDFIAEGLTDAEAIAMQDAMQNLVQDLKYNQPDLFPKPILFEPDVSSDSIYWLGIFKTSQSPWANVDKPYWGAFSTDHTTGPGGLYLCQMDDPYGNGFEELGLFKSGGNQVETPFLINIPTSKSGLSTDTLFCFYQEFDTPQLTKLITCEVGDLLTNTWTPRGTHQNGSVLPVEGTDVHLGYARVYLKADGTYVMHHYAGAAGKRGYSTSPDGINWTRQGIFEEMIDGVEYKIDSGIGFTRNGNNYTIIAAINDGDDRASQRYLVLADADENFLPVSTVRKLTPRGFFKRGVTGFIDESTDKMHVYTKTGTSDNRFNPATMMTFYLTTIFNEN